jgi:ABC-type multidrug transport system ATPase subunit
LASLNAIQKTALMKINLSNAGKRFNREWIFRRADVSFEKGFHTALTGPNGSGKSTLLQCIAGMLELSEGTISFSSISNEKAYNEISFCAPYLELIEEMTLQEFFTFHSGFKPFLPGTSIQDIIDEITLQGATNKQIRYFSSGMKQRARLAQAIFSNTSVVLLDEPCSNLDDKGIALYHSLIEKYCKDRVVLVCSNDPVEYSFCERMVKVMDYK